MGGKLGGNSEHIVSHEGVRFRMLVCGDGLTGGHFLFNLTAVDKLNRPEREGKSRQTRWISKTGHFKLRETASFLFGVQFFVVFTRIAK
jgi:hypothetical protein